MLPTLASPTNQCYMDPPKTPPSKAIRTKGNAVTHSELHRAVLRNNNDLVRRILLRGAGPWGHAGAVDWWGRTPLHRAAERGYVSILVELIGRGGADVNAQETQWLRTCLHMSAERGYENITTVLLSRGADPNIVDRQHFNPLMLAIEKGYEEICEQLLEAGTLVDTRNNQDRTALHIGCTLGNENIVRMLTNVRKRPNNNSDVEARCMTSEGITTPLHLAAVGGHTGCIRALLEQSADVNVRNHMGWSPLHCTAWYSNVQSAAALMSHPTCKLELTSKEGETAYDLIRRRKRQGPLKRDKRIKAIVPAHLAANAGVAMSKFGEKQQMEQRAKDAVTKQMDDALDKKVRRARAFFRTAYTDKAAAIRSAKHVADEERALLSGAGAGAVAAVEKEIDQTHEMVVLHSSTATTPMPSSSPLFPHVSPHTQPQSPDSPKHPPGELDWEHNLYTIRAQIQATVGQLITEQKWAKSVGLEKMIGLLQRAEQTCSAAARTTAASLAAMESWIGNGKEHDVQPTGIAGLLMAGALEGEDEVDMLVSEKVWREDQRVFNVACDILVNDQDLRASYAKRATRSYSWQLKFQELWVMLRDKHGWSVRSSSIRERIEAGARVQVRTSAASALMDSSLTHLPLKERSQALARLLQKINNNGGERSGSGGSGGSPIPLEGTIRTRYKDGTYEVIFSTGESQRVLRQDMVEMEDTVASRGGQQTQEKGALKLYDVVAVKREGWDRWHDAEITKVHSIVNASTDTATTHYTYDVKLTALNTPELELERTQIRKGRAPGSAGSPFYYFKPGALRQSSKSKLGVDFFDSELSLVKHVVQRSNFSGETAALAARRLENQAERLKTDKDLADTNTTRAEQSRTQTLGGDMVRMVFRDEIRRQKLAKESKKNIDQKESDTIDDCDDDSNDDDVETGQNNMDVRLKLSKSAIMRLLSLNSRARTLFTDGSALLHAKVAQAMLKPRLCSAVLNRMDKDHDGMISVHDFVEHCRTLQDNDSRRVVSKWTLENILSNAGAVWVTTKPDGRQKSSSPCLKVTTRTWIDLMLAGDFSGEQRIADIQIQIQKCSTMKGHAIADNDKEDEQHFAGMIKTLELEMFRLVQARVQATESAKIYDLLEQKGLVHGMVLLKEVHRYRDRLELLNDCTRRRAAKATAVVDADVLLNIVQELVHEDQSHKEALDTLGLLFDSIDPHRELPGRDGRVSEPVLLKALASDPQARSLLSLVARKASLHVGLQSETRRQVAARADGLVAALIQQKEDKDEQPKKSPTNKSPTNKSSTLDRTDTNHPPRSGFVGPSELYSSIRQMDAVNRERVVDTIERARAKVVVGNSSSRDMLADWRLTATTHAEFRHIMRSGGLSTTLNAVLLSSDVDVAIATRWNTFVGINDGQQEKEGQPQQQQQMFATFLMNEAIRLGDPKRAMTAAQESLEIIWQIISKCSTNPNKSSTPKCPTPRAILISKHDWMTYFIYPETRMACVSKQQQQEQQEEQEEQDQAIPGHGAQNTRRLTESRLNALPLGLRLARKAPQAHLKALNELSTEFEGYLLQHEMLSFGERQSQGHGLSCLNLEINDATKTRRTNQEQVIRLLFDAVANTNTKSSQNKKKNHAPSSNVRLPKSLILKAIAYETNVRAVLLRRDCPPGLKLATTDPRRFRRLLQRALTASDVSETLAGENSPSKKSKSKTRDAMLSQSDVYEIALKIEREEQDAPRRAMLRNAGDALRNALDLVADEGSMVGVRKLDLLLALKKKRRVIGYVTGTGGGGRGGETVVLPPKVVDLVNVQDHELNDFKTKKEGWVTAKELLVFCGVVGGGCGGGGDGGGV